MPKQILNDMVVKKSIRDIPVPDRTPTASIMKEKMRMEDAAMEKEFAPIKTSESVAPPAPPKKPPYEKPPYADFEDGHFSKVGKGRSLWVWVGGILAVLVIGVIIASLLASANIVLTVKASDYALSSASFSADPSGTSVSGLSYQVINENKDSDPVLIHGTVDQTVSTKATGAIIIYNNYSSAAQKLIANTRFESPSGNIYRIANSVTVPGVTGTKAKPIAGSVQVNVTADVAGASYNTDTSDATGGMTDFTIPGFQGDPRYCATPNNTCKGFYARSATPMTGGYVGTTKVVSQADLQTAKIATDSQVKDALIKEALAQTPRGFVLYSNAYSISFITASTTLGAEGTTIVERGTLSGVLLNRQELSNAIASMAGLGGDSTSTAFIVSNLDTLAFSVASSSKSLASVIAGTPTVDNALTFNLDGNAHLVADVDTSAVVQDALGLPKSDISSLIAKHPGIEAINLTVKPFWKSSIPNDAGRIMISTKEDTTAASSTGQ